jgi:hypothetical protein
MQMTHQAQYFAGLALAAGLAVIGAPAHGASGAGTGAPNAGGLPVWNFDFTYNGTQYSEQIVGAAPQPGAVTTKIPVYIIPIWPTPSCDRDAPCKPISLTDPLAKLPNGRTVIKNVVDSPLFEGAVKFVQGGTDIGKTQYLDALTRLSFWGIGGNASGYHVVFDKPKVTKPVVIDVPPADGSVGTEFGIQTFQVDVNFFDAQIQPLFQSLNIPANALPVFITTQTYLTTGGNCCIGGYHSVSGQSIPYAVATYIQQTGVFAQDVVALSVEMGNLMNNPFTTNGSPCGFGYEVSEGAVNEPHGGAFPYKVHGFTYHLNDLATPVFFGAPASTSLNGWLTFQDNQVSVCQGLAPGRHA